MKKLSIVLLLCLIATVVFGLSGCSSTPNTVVNFSLSDEKLTLNSDNIDSNQGFKIMNGQDHVGYIRVSVVDSKRVKFKGGKIYIHSEDNLGITIDLFASHYLGASKVSFNDTEKQPTNNLQWAIIDNKLAMQTSYIQTAKERTSGDSIDVKIAEIAEMSATHFDWKLHKYIDKQGGTHFPYENAGTVNMCGQDVDLYVKGFAISFSNNKLNYQDDGEIANFDYTEAADKKTISFEDGGKQHTLTLEESIESIKLFLKYEISEGETLIFQADFNKKITA